MKNQILNMGRALTRKEQKQVMGGDLQGFNVVPVFTDPNLIPCSSGSDCPGGRPCVNYAALRFDDKISKITGNSTWVWVDHYFCQI